MHGLYINTEHLPEAKWIFFRSERWTKKYHRSADPSGRSADPADLLLGYCATRLWQQTYETTLNRLSPLKIDDKGDTFFVFLQRFFLQGGSIFFVCQALSDQLIDQLDQLDHHLH